MTACERIKTCPMFAQFRLKASLQVWKSYYCEGHFTRCERWKIVQAGGALPERLLPNGRILEVSLDDLEAGHLYG